MNLRLSLFGGIRVEIEDARGLRPVVLPPRPLALLAYLGATVLGHLHTRDSILAVFWPDRSERLARLALRQALHQLSLRLGPDILVRQGRVFVGLNPQRFSCDVHRFEQALMEARLRDALREYRGEFLEGFLLWSHPEPFDEWLLATRLRLRDSAVAAVTAMTSDESEVFAAGSHPALGWVHRALVLSPYSEDLLARAVDLRLENGDRGGAMNEVRDFSKRLLKDVGFSPSARVLRLGMQAAEDGDRETRWPGTRVRLPLDGLRVELEAVLSGRLPRAERQVEIFGPEGDRLTGSIVVERDDAMGAGGATVRIESQSLSRVGQRDGSLRSDRGNRQGLDSPEHDETRTELP